MNEMIRHGDVILKRVDKVEGKQEKKNSTILAWGEVTGHKHLLSGQMLESVHDNQRYIELEQNATLTHEEHDTLNIPEGKYMVMIQREVDLAGEVRQVMD